MAGNGDQQYRPSRRPEIDDRSISPRPLDSPPERNRSISDALDLLPPNGPHFVRRAIAFHRLPVEVISRLLWLVDANEFASLCLLNRRWYQESQKVELYAHHLSRCPSFALSNNVITGPFRRNDLFRLKTKFAAEVRRNLFQAYLRPRKILINLISVSANSSAAFPGGEAFRFAFSPNGQTLLALSSSRIFVIDVTTDPITIRKELKTLRRPLSASVTDDASLLAVLSSKHQANVYGLTSNGIQHLQVIVLDNPPRTIALAHEGTVLAAAYDTGVEVFSLAANALSTDRRAVRCEAVDCLDFSGDGSMLIGSSRSPDDPNAVVISAPFYAENDPDISPREVHSRQWTTQILFPNNSASISHAALIPNHLEGDANWLFAFDHMLTSYRAVRTDETRTGIAYFLSPIAPRRFSGLPFPSTAPAVSGDGDLVVAGFQNLGLCLYGVPQRLDVSPDMGSVVERHESHVRGPLALTSATGAVEPLMAYSPSAGSSESMEDDSLASRVDWRSSLFVKCKPLKSIAGITATKWVEAPETKRVSFSGKRLVIIAPGGVGAFAEDMGDQNMPVDGGRIMLMDFDYGPTAGPDQEITIEVGENEPELLPEHQGNFQVELALERRRTIRHSGRVGQRGYLGRSVTAITPATGMQSYLEQQLRQGSTSQPSSPSEPLQDIGSPYNPMQPRNQDILHRAATAAGITGARYPARPPLGTQQEQSRGRRQSDDSWVTPPPPYSSGSPDRPPHRGSQPNVISPMSTGLPSPVTSPPQRPTHRDTYSAIQASMQVPMPPQSSSQSPSPILALADPALTPPFRHFTEPAHRVTEPFDPPLRANTSAEMSHLQDHPVQRFGPPIDSTGRLFRQRGISDSSLETVTELGNLHHAVNFMPTHTASAISSPVSMEQSYFTRRRPVSMDGSNRMSNTPLPLSATITHPISPPTPVMSTPSPGLSPPEQLLHERATSLTAANLQSRLNHPVPPLPSPTEQALDQPVYIPPKLQPGHQPTDPALLPDNRNNQPFTLAPPTADQTENLNGRVLQERPRPPSRVMMNGAYTNGVGAHDFRRMSPAPASPHGGWSAADVPGSPSFSHGLIVPNGFSRPTSRDVQGSPPVSVSTPNLPFQHQRSSYGRLDTIESAQSRDVQSAYAENQARRSLSHSAVSPLQEPYTDWRSEAVTPDPKLEKKLRKKEKKRKENEMTYAAYPGEERKKGSRCLVM